MSIIFIILKYLAFVSLTVVSMLLSYNMFSQLSSVPVESALLAVVALSMEFLKIFSLVKGNTLWKLKLRRQAIRAWAFTAILTLLSVLASYGYNLVVVNRGIELANNSAVQIQIDANREELTIVENQIAALGEQIAEANENLRANLRINQIAAATDAETDDITTQFITDQITTLETNRNTYLNRQLELNTAYSQLQIDFAQEQAENRSSVTMFQLMADSFGLDSAFMMLVLLLLISVLIEAGIISSSPVIPIDRKHLSHILSEFAHNLDMDQLEAEQEIDHVKRQQKIHEMYANAAIPDPHEQWNGEERRVEDVEPPKPTQELVELMKEPEPEIETAEDPQDEDPSFFDALKSVLPFGKKKAPAQIEKPVTTPIRQIEEKVEADEPEKMEIEHELHEEDHEPVYTDSGDPIETTLPVATTQVEVEYPVREVKKPIPERKVEKKEEIKLAEKEPTKPVILPKEEKNESSTETPKKKTRTRTVQNKKKESPVKEPEKQETEKNERTRAVPVRDKSRKELPKESEPKKVEETAGGDGQEQSRDDEKPGEPESTKTTTPKPRVKEKVDEKEQAADTDTSDTKDEVKPEKTEPVAEVEVKKSSEEPKQAPRRTRVKKPEAPKREPKKDNTNELHVGKETPDRKTLHAPQEVGETKTYRFGKTNEEVKGMFIKFVNAMFRENGEEYLYDPDVAARDAGIKPGLAKVFIKRLQELKGSNGKVLIEQKDDELYYPNFTKEYIISYSTKELNSSGRVA